MNDRGNFSISDVLPLITKSFLWTLKYFSYVCMVELRIKKKLVTYGPQKQDSSALLLPIPVATRKWLQIRQRNSVHNLARDTLYTFLHIFFKCIWTIRGNHVIDRIVILPRRDRKWCRAWVPTLTWTNQFNICWAKYPQMSLHDHRKFETLENFPE